MTEKHYKSLLRYIRKEVDEDSLDLKLEIKWEKRNIYGSVVRLVKELKLIKNKQETIFQSNDYQNSYKMYQDIVSSIEVVEVE